MLSTSPPCLQYEPVQAATLLTQQQQHEFVLAGRTPSSRSNSNCPQAIRDRVKEAAYLASVPARADISNRKTQLLLPNFSHDWAEKSNGLPLASKHEYKHDYDDFYLRDDRSIRMAMSTSYTDAVKTQSRMGLAWNSLRKSPFNDHI
ncbi:hypothetical protein CFAM422_009708 [Trichoderma lentiforme]|uniref:Uncharacterized protein n=1 Tax=Trichoderma lentiforme TaxID=1567552 RepID=A0A9P4X9X0_9HYPO|nr:hypothetical protein CFAM422_009708 [Trichoderma lentiforme]